MRDCFKWYFLICIALFLAIFGYFNYNYNNNGLRVLATTSLQSSGLLEHLSYYFKKDTGISIEVIALGTGQAIKSAKNGDGDILLVHDKASELQFMQAGFGRKRIEIMYNDFIIIGPKQTVNKKFTNAVSVFKYLYTQMEQNKITFLSRADDSGTHKMEMRLWKLSGVSPMKFSGNQYLETGLGMGSLLNMTSSEMAYSLSDRGTWLSFANKNNLQIIFAGDKVLFNQYSVISLSKQKHPNLAHNKADKLIHWLTSNRAKKLIAEFKVAGKILFIPGNYLPL